MVKRQTFNESNYKDDKFEGVLLVRSEQWTSFGMRRQHKSSALAFVLYGTLLRSGLPDKNCQFNIGPIDLISYSDALRIAEGLDSALQMGIDPRVNIEYVRLLLGPLSKYPPFLRATTHEGSRYGNLTVLYKSDFKDRNGAILYMCKCDCGKEVKVRLGGLKRGDYISCGCVRNEMLRVRQTIDLSGKRSGSLVVLRQFRDGGRTKIECRCDCGAVITLKRENYGKRGRTKCCKKCTGKPKEEMISR